MNASQAPKTKFDIVCDERRQRTAEMRGKMDGLFREKLTILINECGIDAAMNTPDHALAAHLCEILELELRRQERMLQTNHWGPYRPSDLVATQ